jgi:hypothetical protein
MSKDSDNAIQPIGLQKGTTLHFHPPSIFVERSVSAGMIRYIPFVQDIEAFRR